MDHGQSGVHIYCSFLPPDSLLDVVGETDSSQEVNHGYIFWAVAQDFVHDILREGFRPKHRRSIPVAVDVNEAKSRYRSKDPSGTPRVIRIRMELARAEGFHVFEHDRGLSLHMPHMAEKVSPNLLELADSQIAQPTGINTLCTPPGITDAKNTQALMDVPAPEVPSEDCIPQKPADQDMEVAGDKGTASECPEFPRMKQGRNMLLYLRTGEGSDQKRWVQGRIVEGGTSRTEVRVQVKLGKLSLAQHICLNSSRVLEFYHPDACQLADTEAVQAAQVRALHASLSPGGELRNNQNVFKHPPSISSLKLGRTTLAKSFIVPDGQMPQNGKADFFKRLDAFLKNAPTQDAAGKERVALPRPKPKTGDTVRCFAVFECQAAIPCPCGESDFDVIAMGSISDDRPGHYHLWDECNGKDVYKKYGSEMYLYACHGHDLTIGKLHFDMFDLKEYSHYGAPVLKARGIDLYLFYEWYKQSGNDLGQGRWILGQKVAKCPMATSLEMSDFLGMTEITTITSSEGWPPWPPNTTRLRLNEGLRDVIEDEFKDLFECAGLHRQDRQEFKIRHGEHIWAFGSNPAGQEHIATLRGYSEEVPRDGWKGIVIVKPEGRRFASSVVMARKCRGDGFESLERKSTRPTKGCLGTSSSGLGQETCHFQSEAIFIEPYDPSNPEHQLMGEHKSRECPECFKLGDRCSKLAAMNRGNCQSVLELWMRGRIFHATEGGLETTITFEGIQVRVFCYPDVFAYEKDVWELGQKALASSNNKNMFDAAFRLLTDRTLGDEPNSLAHVLLLLSNVTKPKPTNLQAELVKETKALKQKPADPDPLELGEDTWKASAAVNAAVSAEVVNVLTQTVTADVEQQGEHLRQKNAIAEVLKEQFGFNSQQKTGDPHGWITFALKKAKEWKGLEVDECYHGTSMTALAPILLEGLKKPKSKADRAHGQHGSKSQETIYLSPSWHYSAHPVYSPLHMMGSGPNAFQMVFKCEVLRGQYRTQSATFGGKHWPKEVRIDPERDTLENLEYLVEDEGTVRLKEVMFRKFGNGADPAIFGDLPPKLLVDGRPKLEYRWTEMLQEDFKARGFYLSGHQHA